MGLVISAEEIFRDRKIMERERFLNLSRLSYLQSKIVILFMFSAIQTLSFVLIGNYYLEIEGMGFRYFLILFTTACWANLLGLNISSGFNSVVTIYILIPLVLVPQLLLSGTVIDFNNMNPKARSVKYVPIIGDLTTSRWAYEALAVTQFKDNDFQKHFFDLEKTMDNAIYNRSVLLPLLEDKLAFCLSNINDNTKYEAEVNNFELLQHELNKIQSQTDKSANDILKDLTIENFTPGVYEKALDYLLNFDVINRKSYQFASYDKEQEYDEMVEKLGSVENFVRFNQNRIIRLKSPIYRDPLSNKGRAHYFSPYKKIGRIKIDTLWFNIIFIWLYASFFYVALYYEWLRKLIRYLEYMKLLRFSQRKLFKLLQGEHYRGNGLRMG